MTKNRKAFIVGHPVAQSRSPIIHNHWIAHHGLQGSYERVDVTPDQFGDFINSIRRGEYIGGNITMPHKDAAFRAADHLTERAQRLRAVNTLWMENGKLHGDNTDIIGFTENLDHTLGSQWYVDITDVQVIGAGGAARAVVAGLLQYPNFHITIINRTLDKAKDFLPWDEERIRVSSWDNLSTEVKKAGLIVNTTSLGMVGYPPLDIDFSGCDPSTIVADIVYIPLLTPMLEAAKKSSLRIVDGLGMLLHQAAPGFSRWFGIKPKVTDELRQILLRDIGEK